MEKLFGEQKQFMRSMLITKYRNIIYSLMIKKNPLFKGVRNKVISQHANPTVDNITLNPTHQVSFRGIRRHIIEINNNSSKPLIGHSPLTPNTISSKTYENSHEKDFHKFSTLLESKGYTNNPAKHKSEEGSFCTLGNLKLSKQHIYTERNRPETDRENQAPALQAIAQRCKQIRTRQYMSPQQNEGQLNSLGKLKSRLLITPLKEKQNMFKLHSPTKQDKASAAYEHSSILSEHDLVNMSKANDTIDFDMSPFL